MNAGALRADIESLEAMIAALHASRDASARAMDRLETLMRDATAVRESFATPIPLTGKAYCEACHQLILCALVFVFCACSTFLHSGARVNTWRAHARHYIERMHSSAHIRGDCAVCRDETSSDAWVVLPCKHALHRSCAMDNATHGGPHSATRCPLCRASIFASRHEYDELVEASLREWCAVIGVLTTVVCVVHWFAPNMVWPC